MFTCDQCDYKAKTNKAVTNHIAGSVADPASGAGYGSGALGPDLGKIFKIPLTKFSR